MTDTTWKNCKRCNNAFSFNNEMAFCKFQYCPQCVAANPSLEAVTLGKPTHSLVENARRRIAIADRIALLSTTKENKARKRETRKDARRGSFMNLGAESLHGSRKYYFKTVFFNGVEFNGIVEPGAVPAKGSPAILWQEFNAYVLRVARSSAITKFLKEHSRLVADAPPVEIIDRIERAAKDKAYSGQFKLINFPVGGDSLAFYAMNPAKPPPSNFEIKEALMVWSSKINQYVFLKIQ